MKIVFELRKEKITQNGLMPIQLLFKTWKKFSNKRNTVLKRRLEWT
jgi:hypothetical protein